MAGWTFAWVRSLGRVTPQKISKDFVNAAHVKDRIVQRHPMTDADEGASLEFLAARHPFNPEQKEAS